MLKLMIPAVLVLAGCASSPEYVSSSSNFDVCRLTMGGPHARNAEIEAQRRGLDCRPLYPAILQRQAAQNAATQNYINSLQRPAPAPIQRTCNSYRLGNSVQTDCF
jgi:hypothetical protein